MSSKKVRTDHLRNSRKDAANRDNFAAQDYESIGNATVGPLDAPVLPPFVGIAVEEDKDKGNAGISMEGDDHIEVLSSDLSSCSDHNRLPIRRCALCGGHPEAMADQQRRQQQQQQADISDLLMLATLAEDMGDGTPQSASGDGEIAEAEELVESGNAQMRQGTLSEAREAASDWWEREFPGPGWSLSGDMQWNLFEDAWVTRGSAMEAEEIPYWATKEYAELIRAESGDQAIDQLEQQELMQSNHEYGADMYQEQQELMQRNHDMEAGSSRAVYDDDDNYEIGAGERKSGGFWDLPIEERLQRSRWQVRRKERRKETFLSVAKDRAKYYARFEEEKPTNNSDSDGDGDQAPSSSKNTKIITWQPSRNASLHAKFHQKSPTSLQNLCINVLAHFAQFVESFLGVPDDLRSSIASAFCARRQLNAHVLSLLLQNCPSKIRIPDCSNVNENEMAEILTSFCASQRPFSSIQELHLGFCGRSLPDECLIRTLAHSPDAFPLLQSISLTGAYRFHDESLHALLRAAPHVTHLDFSHCCVLSDSGIEAIADCVGAHLKTLILENCQKLEAAKLLPSLGRMTQLQKLSLAAVPGMIDSVVTELAVQFGGRLRELSLNECSSLTDAAMAAVGACCPSLRALNLDCLTLLTDIAIARITDGCKMLEILTLTRCKLSDEAVATFVTASGGSLSELSVNNVRKVADQTLFALAKHTRGCLKILDASWCRQMSDNGLGLLADSCPNLRELKLFGCTQVTHTFLEGHSNLNLKIIGL